mgnify:CR=1 FL=1
MQVRAGCVPRPAYILHAYHGTHRSTHGGGGARSIICVVNAPHTAVRGRRGRRQRRRAPCGRALAGEVVREPRTHPITAGSGLGRKGGALHGNNSHVRVRRKDTYRPQHFTRRKTKNPCGFVGLGPAKKVGCRDAPPPVMPGCIRAVHHTTIKRVPRAPDLASGLLRRRL